MAAQNYTSGNTSAQQSTVGQQFGWSLDYDPDISTGQTGAPVQRSEGQITAITNGQATVKMSDGTSQQIQLPTKAIQDTDSKGHSITRYIADPKANVGSLKYETDAKGHTYQYYVFQQANNAPLVTEKGSQVLQDWALKAQSSNPQDRASFADMQNRLVTAGLLPKGKFIPGMPDDATQQALQSAVVLASRTGETVDEALGQSASTFSKATQASLTSPEQINALVQSVAPNVIGRKAPQAVVDAITQHLHDLQTQAATDAGTVSSDDVTAAPTANSAWFQEQLKELLPNTSKSYQTFQGLSALQNTIGQPVAQTYHA